MDARDMLVEAIFEGEGILSHLICDYSVGCVLVTKILSTGCLSAEERIRLAALVRKVIPGSRKAESNNHKKLVEELSQIPMTLKDDKLKSSVHPPAPGFYLSPTRNIQTTSQAAEEPLPLKYSSSYVLPTPNQSPVHNQKQEKKFYHPGH